MKKYLLIFPMIFLLFSCSKEENQIATIKAEISDSTKNITKLQQFLSKKGILIVKDFYDVGDIEGNYSTTMNLNAVVFYEPGKEEERIRGLRIDVNEAKSYGHNTESAFLDLDELESLSKALDYMTKLKKDWESTPKEYTEVIFETKGNFRAGFFKQKNEITTFTNAGYGNGSHCFFKNPEDLLKLKSKIDEGIILLKGK